MRRTPVLIIGGGPAGAAAAITLACNGVAPEVIERSACAHDVVCGGFLGWDALAALRQLKIDAAALGARPIRRVRLVAGSRSVEAELPYGAAGLSRRRLDEALLERAGAAGAIVSRGRLVKLLDPDERIARLDDGSEFGADAIVLATGKHELRGAARPLTGRAEPSAGMRAKLPACVTRDHALDGVIELHLYDEGYAGLLLQEDGSANLCLSVSRRRLSRAGGPAALFDALCKESPLLAERVGGDVPRSWQAIAGVPYGWRAESTQAGVYRVGDQGAVIASLAGDGVAIALTSGIGVAEAIIGAQSAATWQRRLRRRAAAPIMVAEVLRFAAERERYRGALLQLMSGAPWLAGLAARVTRIG